MLERKKCVLELYSLTTQYFIMKKKILVSKCSIRMDSLLNKSEIHEIITVRSFYDLHQMADPINPRKVLNAKIEIKLSLCQPLLKPEIITKQERWVQIDFNQKGKVMDISASVSKTIIPEQIKVNKILKVVSPEPSDNIANTDELEDAILAFRK